MSGFEHLLVGQTLGAHYLVHEVLGGGGFGVVFRAEDQRPGRARRDVAVKVLAVPPGVDEGGRARLRERFRREAAFAAALPRHPNVVPIFDYGSDRGFDFLVMELLHGEDLRRRLLRPEPLPLARALRILRDAARGIAVGHREGLVHRDVKPANVFLERGEGGEPAVRVLDFGIAKRLEEGDGDGRTPTHVTRHGEGFFSGRYASPEQLRRESTLTRASDVFSLGVVGWELLTRARPFTDADQARREAGQAVPVPSLVARCPELPPLVEQVIVRAMEDDPAARFRDAGAFEEALRQACRASGLRLDGAVPPRPAAAAPPPAAEEATVAAAPEEEATVFAGPETVFAGAETDGAEPETAFDRRASAAAAAEAEAAAFAERRAAAAREATLRKQRKHGWFGRAETDGAPPPVVPESERRTDPAPRRWHRRMDIPRRRAIAMAVGIFFLLGGAVALSAAAVASGAGLLGKLWDWSGESAEEAARRDRSLALEANANGRRLFGDGEFAEALERFRRAHELAPEVAEYHNNVGWALFKLKRGPEAVRVLEAVIAKHPRRQIAYENLAAAHLLAGDTLAAVGALERLLAMHPPRSRERGAERLLARLRRPDPAPAFADTAFVDPGTVIASAGTDPLATPVPAVADSAAWLPPPPLAVDSAVTTTVDTAPPAAPARTEARQPPRAEPVRRRTAGPRDTLHLDGRLRLRDTVRMRRD